MKYVALFVCAFIVAGCDQMGAIGQGPITPEQLEDYFRKHPVNGNKAVALKKRSLGGDSYLLTVHGYPNNLGVCAELIAPYNSDSSLSTVPGTYFCEELK